MMSFELIHVLMVIDSLDGLSRYLTRPAPNYNHVEPSISLAKENRHLQSNGNGDFVSLSILSDLPSNCS